jgi:hypothetical protein
MTKFVNGEDPEAIEARRERELFKEWAAALDAPSPSLGELLVILCVAPAIIYGLIVLPVAWLILRIEEQLAAKRK